MRLKWKWKSDCSGTPLRAGDKVRICAVPNLRGMSASALRESLPVFRHAVGKEFRIRLFSDYGFAGIDFAIPTGVHRGWHTIYIETSLLKKGKR